MGLGVDRNSSCSRCWKSIPCIISEHSVCSAFVLVSLPVSCPTAGGRGEKAPASGSWSDAAWNEEIYRLLWPGRG